MTSRTLIIENPAHRKLALRICELANIVPANVSTEEFTVHRNHITYQEIPPRPTTKAHINKRTGRFITKQRTIRNPLPKSAWKENQ